MKLLVMYAIGAESYDQYDLQMKGPEEVSYRLAVD